MLKIDITAKNISLDEPLKEFVYERIGSLEHVAAELGPVPVRVEIGKSTRHHHKGPFMYAEANMKVGGTLLRATCEHEDLRNAIVDVKHELERQIKKLKEKRTDDYRKDRK